MTTLALKSYQQAALDALAAFARAAQLKGPTLAFQELAGRPYNPDAFGAVPCVCLRIPTGGGTALKRLNPGAILELTATPIATKTNVLYHVSAQELAAESMIKLPIALAKHAEGWRQAVFAAVQTQRAPEGETLKDEAASYGYVRPIVLFQAQNENDEVPPEALRRHLEEELHIPREQIVVATGDSRELQGLDLASRQCPVRFVITVQALREGWDCPFAYVLCSLQKLSSATAVEQLLGRVLHMPYASRRGREALNRAYAHVCEAEFSTAANELADRLINSMGFEALDVASMLMRQAVLPLFESNQPPAQAEQAQIATDFIASAPPPELRAAAGVTLAMLAGEQKAVVTGHISPALEALLLAQVRGAKKHEQLQAKVAQHNALVAAQTAPASRGERFAPVPTLGYRDMPQAPLWPLEREAVLEAVELDLLSPDAVRLPGFQLVEQSSAFEIYLKDAHIKLRAADDLAAAPCGFAPATSRGRFFPDFVADLLDGRIAVVEYKGAHLLNDPYEIEKRQVGELWARKSGGRCIFGQIVKDKSGVGIQGQLDVLLA